MHVYGGAGANVPALVAFSTASYFGHSKLAAEQLIVDVRARSPARVVELLVELEVRSVREERGRWVAAAHDVVIAGTPARKSPLRLY